MHCMDMQLKWYHLGQLKHMYMSIQVCGHFGIMNLVVYGGCS